MIAIWLAAIVAFLSGTPFALFVANTILLAVIGAAALNLLMGVAGQVSIGNAAFLAVGAYGAATFQRLGIGFPVDLVLSCLLAALIGLLVGLPALRIRGLYLVLATLAAHFIVIDLLRRYQVSAVGEAGFLVDRPFDLSSQIGYQRIWLALLVVTVSLVIVGFSWLLFGKAGRAWQMIRTNELTAASLGIDVTRYKLGVFAFASGLIGLQGALAAHFAGIVIAEQFSLGLAVAYIAMIVIGGMGSISGSIIGATIVVGLPYLLPWLLGVTFGDGAGVVQYSPRIARAVYGLLIVVFVTLSPRGAVGWVGSVTAKLRKSRSSQARTVGL